MNKFNTQLFLTVFSAHSSNLRVIIWEALKFKVDNLFNKVIAGILLLATMQQLIIKVS